MKHAVAVTPAHLRAGAATYAASAATASASIVCRAARCPERLAASVRATLADAAPDRVEAGGAQVNVPIAAVVPTLDPPGCIVDLTDNLCRCGFSPVVVVDDGSKPAHASTFATLEERGCVVLRHGENRGKGAALKTAIAYLRSTCPDLAGFVTVDDDGQHRVDDAVAVAHAAAIHPHALVLGVRDLRAPDVPLRSRLGAAFSSLFFRLDTGRACPDTQTGLRFMPMEMCELALLLEGDHYDFEMNLLTRIAKGGGELVMVPIETVYHDGNRASRFRTVVDSYRIYRSLVRCVLSSATCAALDLGLFTLLVNLLSLQQALLVLAATAGARVASGLVNFTLNRRWSFRGDAAHSAASCAGGIDGVGDANASKGKRAFVFENAFGKRAAFRADVSSAASRQLVRYGVLFVAQMLASGCLVLGLAWLPVPLTLVKALVDGCLFVVSYFVQRNWVFAGNARQRVRSAHGAGRAGAGVRGSHRCACDASASENVAQGAFGSPAGRARARGGWSRPSLRRRRSHAREA